MNIFIFRRDFRLYDNLGLINAIKNCKNILPIFIFTPEQIKNNEFKSDNAIQFLVESLHDLNKQLKKYNSKLHIFYGTNLSVLNKINNIDKISNIFCNKDYTPYSKKRDMMIKTKYNLNHIEDYLLHDMGTLLKEDNTPYKVFTPFYNKALTFKVNKPCKFKYSQYSFIKKKYDFMINLDYISKFYNYNENIFLNGGREKALQRLKKVNLINYNDTRNLLNIESSHLSPYIKYGCLSIREIYHKLKKIYF